MASAVTGWIVKRHENRPLKNRKINFSGRRPRLSVAPLAHGFDRILRQSFTPRRRRLAFGKEVGSKMLTIFSTPKPFRGHIGVIQRNAIESWKQIHPEVEIILFGDEEGAAEAARAMGIRHEPRVERNEHGTKYLTSIFDQAHEIARHPILCYVNCDIVLLSDFRSALQQVSAKFPRFLMVGRRWDTPVAEPLDFDLPDWE
jgi:hypothetical protein